MHASSSYQNSGSKVTKIAIVTVLHIAVAFALINMKILVTPTPDQGPMMFDPGKPLPPPVAPEPVVEAPPAAPAPPVFVPFTDIISEPLPNTPHAVTNTPPVTPPAIEGPPPVVPPAVPPVKPVDKKGGYMAALANAGDCALPDYPAKAARDGNAGTVGLALLIAPDGRVTDSRVTSSSGFRELDRAALAALSLCKFKPATNNGVPEAVWGKIAYVWTLE